MLLACERESSASMLDMLFDWGMSDISWALASPTVLSRMPTEASCEHAARREYSDTLLCFVGLFVALHVISLCLVTGYAAASWPLRGQRRPSLPHVRRQPL